MKAPFTRSGGRNLSATARKPWNRGERFEVEVSGDPSAQLTFHGWHPTSIEAGLKRNPGIVATAIHGVSAIPAVCRAEPGIRSYLDLPLVTGRAAAKLARKPS